MVLKGHAFGRAVLSLMRPALATEGLRFFALGPSTLRHFHAWLLWARNRQTIYFFPAPAVLIFASNSFAGPWYGPSMPAAFCKVATASALWFCLA